MAKEPRDAMGRLALAVPCMDPDVADLSSQQQCALHEFAHTMLAAGYKLYQVVPPSKADPIIKKKFGLIIPKD
jgi:hypothetical protein